MQLINSLLALLQLLPDRVPSGRQELFVQVIQLLVIVHLSDYALAPTIIELEDFRPDNLLDGLGHALVNLSPGSVGGHIRGLGRVLLTCTENLPSIDCCGRHLRLKLHV